MPKNLYNEGRVVGYSTYELYVKHALSEFPDEEPATEREWLAAQLARGQSMILRVPKESSNNGYHRIVFKLPENSKLVAANTIVGSLFLGNCEFDDNNWATKVIDYGQLISNTESSHPQDSNTSDNIPYQTQHELGNSRNTDRPYELTSTVATEKEKSQLLQYIKIQDGLILQAGNWFKEDDWDDEPYVDFKPDYHQVPSVVLTLSTQVTTEFYILLTGFTDRTIVAGLAGTDTGSLQEIKPQNGDFLGPEQFPWANKIIFTTPTAASYLLRKYIQSGHEGRRGINNTDSGTTRKDNLRIDHNDDDINTVAKSSYLYSEDGVSIVGPLEPGGDISIASKVKDTDATYQKFIKVTQKHSDNSHIKDATVLEHSKINAGDGISFQPPKTDGGDVTISSIVESLNNYLKVVQDSESESNDGSETTTTLQTSQIKSSGNGVKVTPPSSPGADVTITSNFSGGYLINISGGSGNLVISVDEDAFNSAVNTLIQNVTDPLEKKINKLRKMIGSLTDTLNKLLALIGPDGGKLLISNVTNNNPSYSDSDFDKAFDIDWNSLTKATISNINGKIALGNINVYSGSDFLNHKIVTHEGPTHYDIRVK